MPQRDPYACPRSPGEGEYATAHARRVFTRVAWANAFRRPRRGAPGAQRARRSRPGPVLLRRRLVLLGAGGVGARAPDARVNYFGSRK